MGLHLINGVPAHVLLVHAVVVLVPLPPCPSWSAPCGRTPRGGSAWSSPSSLSSP